MGGSDYANNIVCLSVEDHAKAHQELFEKYGHIGDKVAHLMLSGKTSEGEAALHELYVEAGRNHKGWKPTPETRAKMSAAQTAQRERKSATSTRAKQSATRRIEGRQFAKLTHAQVLAIYARRDESPSALAEEFNISVPVICNIKSGKRWSHLTGLPNTRKKRGSYEL